MGDKPAARILTPGAALTVVGLVLLLAGATGGALNSVAGGGSFIVFPVWALVISVYILFTNFHHPRDRSSA
jgi:hypothetical protein